mmetsp:Transcript_106405/g.185069  ORF Transcript_106405/g.185069 Transcript_106405/m.185069 type:complete len:591 (+) Transcript_106405:162-1934(+)
MPQQDSASGSTEFPPHLRVLRQLGRGAYGTVHLCEDTNTGTQVAVKHVKHAARHGKSMLREVRLLARLQHENLLHLVDFPAVTGPNFDDIFLVLPYLPADLHRVIQSRQALSDKHVQVIICQILRALAHLHAAGVAHRDLKPANILLTSDCRLKVCDFGLARGDMPDPDGDDEPAEACGVLTEYVVTRWYRAPEVMLLPKKYNSAVDVWSVGCILGEILGRRALFPGKNHIDMVCRVAQVLGTPSDDELGWLPKASDAYRFLRKVCPKSDGVPLATLYPQASRACLDLLHGLLGWDPAQRLTAVEAQEHEYLRNYLPKERPVPPEPFDWSFDGFKPTTHAVKERLYQECCRYHPEMLERDSSRDAPPRSSETFTRGAPRGTDGARSKPAEAPRAKPEERSVRAPGPAISGSSSVGGLRTSVDISGRPLSGRGPAGSSAGAPPTRPPLVPAVAAAAAGAGLPGFGSSGSDSRGGSLTAAPGGFSSASGSVTSAPGGSATGPVGPAMYGGIPSGAAPHSGRGYPSVNAAGYPYNRTPTMSARSSPTCGYINSSRTHSHMPQMQQPRASTPVRSLTPQRNLAQRPAVPGILAR